MKKKDVRKVKRGKGGYGAALAGGLIGAALGVGAGLLLSSKTGKQLGKKAKNLYAGFYRYIAPQIKKMKKMGEAEYKQFVAGAMNRYSKDKKLSQTEARQLVRDAQASWKHLKKNL